MNKLKIQVKLLLELFHKNVISIDQLKNSLLLINPNVNELYKQYYVDWVNDNIDGYKKGDHYLLSLTSSGGMLESLDD